MAMSPNFDLKERLDICFKDETTLNPLCRSISSGMFYIHIYNIYYAIIYIYLFKIFFILLYYMKLMNNNKRKDQH